MFKRPGPGGYGLQARTGDFAGAIRRVYESYDVLLLSRKRHYRRPLDT